MCTLLETRIVNAELLTDAITDFTSQSLTCIVETSQSVQNGLFNTSWFVSFETESHSPLGKTLRILSVKAIALVVTYKPKTIQCTRCF